MLNQQPTLTASLNGHNTDHSLTDLITKLQEIEFLDNHDISLPLNQLTADEQLNIIVPNMGRFTMTDWSRSQLSTAIGCRFNKYFENASPSERMSELNLRFARANHESQVRLRTTLIGAGTNGSDGTLKAIVSPSFTAIPDSQVIELIFRSLNEVEPDLRLIKADITTRSTSLVIGISKPFIPGGLQEIGDIFGSIYFRSSGVGFSSLSMTLFLHRLICKNGMTVPLRNAEILRCRHTSGLSLERIQEQIGNKFQEIPGQLRRAGQILQSSRAVGITNVEDTITRILRDAGLPRKLVQPLMLAYNREPGANAFNVAQAMTDNATLDELGMKPEERHQLETAAGEYLRSVTNQQ
ncbi:MAG: hypothetical protein V1897_12495 [Pseudomonadota bacterium]